ALLQQGRGRRGEDPRRARGGGGGPGAGAVVGAAGLEGVRGRDCRHAAGGRPGLGPAGAGGPAGRGSFRAGAGQRRGDGTRRGAATMMDAQTQALLQTVLRRESLPGCTTPALGVRGPGADEGGGRAGLGRVVGEARWGTRELGRSLPRQRIMPAYIGSFPTEFTSMGFVSLRFLVPKLVAAQRQEIASLEADVAAV